MVPSAPTETPAGEEKRATVPAPLANDAGAARLPARVETYPGEVHAAALLEPTGEDQPCPAQGVGVTANTGHHDPAGQMIGYDALDGQKKPDGHG